MAVSVEIFGIKGYLFDELKAALVDRLDGAAVEYYIRDLQKIDDFLEEGIESVPAVRVNHKMLFTKTNGKTTGQMVSEVMQYVSNFNQPQIICPIDFSPCSMHAAAWAMRFASEFRMGLLCIHVIRPLAESGYSVQINQEVMEESMRVRLKQLADKEGMSDLQVQTATFIGDPLQVIVKLSKGATAALVVMGTKGLTGIGRKLLGTVSSSVTRHSLAPVLLIPPHIDYKKPEHIMVAFHEEMVSNGSFKALLELNKLVKASLHFVNVNDDGDYDSLKNKVTSLLHAHGAPDLAFDIHQVHQLDSTVMQALTAYANEHQPDMMVFMTRNRNLIRSLVQPGLTAQMQAHLNWPLLVMRNCDFGFRIADFGRG